MASPMVDDDGVVLAAGGVVWRSADAAGPGSPVEVLVVHRPRYLDWSFPKGKREPADPDDAACAVREVAEETGYSTELGAELPSTTYRDAKHRPKRVRYWSMRAVDGSFTPNAEVDEVRWLPAGEARALLTYPHDRAVLDAFSSRAHDAPRA
jgi:8-oxo-dGTP pyrophosphatase MutT (NUDIX family)